MNEFYSWGLHLGSVAGIRVRLHWFLLLYWVLELDGVLRTRTPQYRPYLLVAWGLGVGLLFLSILLHELGHCFAARSVGGYADDILLWPLGGLAYCHCPDRWKSHLALAAGGPLVTMAITVVSYAGFLLADRLVDPWILEHPMALLCYAKARRVLVDWNLFILIFNLLPLYPMDGGRIFHALLWGFFSRNLGHAWGGYARASRITLLLSRITGIIGIAYAAAWARDVVMVSIFVWALFCAESLREE